jgi:hypothetical protein
VLGNSSSSLSPSPLELYLYIFFLSSFSSFVIGADFSNPFLPPAVPVPLVKNFFFVLALL